jgi:WD40 repeat protein
MSDLRSILERGVGSFDPQPPGLEDVARRLRRRQRNRRVASAAIALFVAAAGISFAVIGLQGTKRSPRTPSSQVTKPLPANGDLWVRVGGGDGPSFVYQANTSTGSVTPLWHDQSGASLPGTLNETAIGEQYAWAPDGSQIAFSDYTGAHEQTAIFLMDPAGTKRTQLTSGRGMASFPAWSPDGTRIAYASYTGPPPPNSAPFYDPGCEYAPECPSNIVVINTDGTGTTQLTRAPIGGTMPSWSPDGSKIAFVGRVGNNTQIFVMNADGSDVVELTASGRATEPEWSPDGKKIAFLRTFTPSPGSAPSLPTGATPPVGNSETELFVMNSDGSGVQQLSRVAPASPAAFAWSPDGTQIVFDTNDDAGTLTLIRPDGVLIRKIDVAPHLPLGDIAWRPVPAPPPTTTKSIIELPPLPVQGIVAMWSRPNNRFGVTFLTLNGHVVATVRNFTVLGPGPGSVLLKEYPHGLYGPGHLYLLEPEKHQLRRAASGRESSLEVKRRQVGLPRPFGGVGRWGWSERSPDGLEILAQWYQQVGECSKPVAMLGTTGGNTLPSAIPIVREPLAKSTASYAMGWTSENRAVVEIGGPCGGTATLGDGVYLFKGTQMLTRVRMPQGSYNFAMWGG